MNRCSGARAFARSGLLAAAVSLAALVGCGGGEGGTSRVAEPITEANQAEFNGDDLFLAQRAATGPWLSAPIARQFHKDLSAIRALNARVADIHVFGVTPDGYFLDPILRDVYVSVKKSAPWYAAWNAGTLKTGDTSVDGVLNEFHPASVEPFVDWGDGYASFRIRFAPPLNTTVVAAELAKASTQFEFADPDGMGGDGDDITFQQSGADHKYTFSTGWGDCPAGCIQRHYWEFTVHPDSSISQREYGSALDGPGGPGRAAAVLTTKHSRSAPVRNN